MGRPIVTDEINEVSNRVIGAAIEVHKILGPGFLESMYEEALIQELVLRGLHVERQKKIEVRYKGFYIGEGRLDLLIEDQLIVELKAVESLLPLHSVQVLSYLKTLNLPLGLLINFNVIMLKHGIKRIILT